MSSPESNSGDQRPSPPQQQQLNNSSSSRPFGEPGRERSLRSDDKCYVRFVNTTQLTVDLVWLDYQGQRVKHRSLAPQTAHSVLTYHTHPWIFLDAETHRRLAIKKRRVKADFFESGDFLAALREGAEYTPEQVQGLADGRGLICVFIQLPVDDLRSLALKTVRRCIERKEDCFCLRMPQPLQFELAQMFM